MAGQPNIYDSLFDPYGQASLEDPNHPGYDLAGNFMDGTDYSGSSSHNTPLPSPIVGGNDTPTATPGTTTKKTVFDYLGLLPSLFTSFGSLINGKSTSTATDTTADTTSITGGTVKGGENGNLTTKTTPNTNIIIIVVLILVVIAIIYALTRKK